jgi:hypothetical protein
MYVWCIIYDTYSFYSEYCILNKNATVCHILLRQEQKRAKRCIRIGAQRCLHFCTRKLLRKRHWHANFSTLYLAEKLPCANQPVQTLALKKFIVWWKKSGGMSPGSKNMGRFHSTICIANFWAKRQENSTNSTVQIRVEAFVWNWGALNDMSINLPVLRAAAI